jgi:ABC-type branched-subunit amino acid transport system substrate-binding protein
MTRKIFIQTIIICLMILKANVYANDSINIGLNYPKTGPYSVQGLDQLRAAKMAVSEINYGGGILGKKIKLIIRDSESNPNKTRKNVIEMIKDYHVKMIFGGSSSAVAIAASEICQQEKVLFFGTLTYSTATTGIHAHRHTFRECYNSWMGAKAIGAYLKNHFNNKRYFYITADYTWGHSTEASMRKITNTDDNKYHIGLNIPFPNAKEFHFKRSLAFANMISPDVLVLVLFGKDMENAIRLATSMGMKSKMQVVVPNLTLGMAEGAGPKVMEGVIGSLPWCWQVPYKYNYEIGKKFVEAFVRRYNRYPSTSGASAYTILYEFKNAATRTQSFYSTHLVLALENHKYQLLKDEQIWRKFDHQSIQTVYAVKCKEKKYVLRDQFKLDYFDIISRISGKDAARTRDEWILVRKKAGKPLHLESL